MSTDTRKMYEAMFLFPQAATANLQAAVDHVHEILAKAEAEIVSFAKWDERRLAYDIDGNKRGVYFLAYLRMEPSAVATIERSCNLSEQILRAMVLRAELIPSEIIEAAEGRSQLNDEVKMRSEEPAAATTDAG